MRTPGLALAAARALRVAAKRMPALALALAIGLGAMSAVALAQELPAGVRWGMDADALRAAVPDASRVARPQRLAGGVAGTWHAPPVRIADALDAEPVFFFGGGRLVRVEHVAAGLDAPDRGEAAFAALRDWGRERFGAELATRDPGSEIAAWVDGDTDVYVQRTVDARGATVRLVRKLRVVKDGRAL
ncbi:hypothetical protein NF681_01490 (plasmid) [Comamonadaceae bacterium OTU4NAUVB1]|nr:hypothetical protein NF681_01490 [Comamonadaceae bacterium OTU4NAUVB1]